MSTTITNTFEIAIIIAVSMIMLPLQFNNNNNAYAGGIYATLAADSDIYEGPCPVQISFYGSITHDFGGEEVVYRFIRSDGGVGPEQTLYFDTPGTQPVSTTWDLGGSGLSYHDWVAIEILSPIHLVSEHADFQVYCYVEQYVTDKEQTITDK